MTRLAIAIFVFLFATTNTFSQDLRERFENPPQSAKPKTWMHAMSGNMSKVGMTRDLEAIAAAGQGGVLLFNIANGIPYGNVPYNSEEHHEIIAHAAKECERLDLSFGVHNCDGWTSSGGPWIKPEDSMKMVVYTEEVVEGGREISLPLTQPATLEGFYKDIAVLAYPALKSEIDDAAFDPTITSSNKDFDISLLKLNGKIGTSVLDKNGEENPWITFDFGEQKEISSLYLSYLGTLVKTTLQVSADGKDFTPIKTFERFERLGKLQWVISEQFDVVKSRYFRLEFARDLEIININLSATKPFKNFTKYSGFAEPPSYADIAKNPQKDILIDKSTIIDLSSSLSPEGILNARLPKGKWTVMRFGFTSTGAKNWPASKWGIGLECDKFSRPAMLKHFNAFSQKVIDNSKKTAPNALQYIEIDSYEMGGQNWTDDFDKIFKEDKGYDLIPFLPVYAGRYVESAEAVAGVAYDLNDLFTRLVTNNYFKYFTELCNKNGLKSYIEPYGGGPVSPLDVSAHIDLPMTEFWMNRDKQKRLTGTIHGAHVYGKNVISAEAFTSTPELNWDNHPALAKTWGDMAWVAGVNEFMFHRYVHQPNTKVAPGLTMGKWGSHFDRTQTWWKNAGVAWFKYIARGSYLLRQGYPVADVLIFSGDRPHSDGLSRNKLKYKLPTGLNYDFTNGRALINRFKIIDKSLVLPEGNAYSYLILHDMKITTLKTLHKIKEIVDAGIPVIGEKPLQLAGYSVSTNDKAEFKDLTNYIWSRPNCFTKYDFMEVQPDFEVVGKQVPFIHRKSDSTDIYFFYNKENRPMKYECVFKVVGKIPELWDSKSGQTTKLANYKTEGDKTRLWIDFNALESAFIIFKEPTVKSASVIGNYTNLQFSRKSDNSIVVEAHSNQASSIKLSNGKMIKIPGATLPLPIDLSRNWDVEFLKEHHYGAKHSFKELIDWKDSDEDGIKYYSGAAIYTKTFKLDKKVKDDLKYILDLNNVDIVAEVLINNRNAGTLWMAPFEIDITEFLRKGDNHLEIKITNQWANRLIGDENYPKQDGGYNTSSYIPNKNSQMPAWYVNNEDLPVGPRVTFSSWSFNKKGDSLKPSGLKGPVKIKYQRIINIQ
ncbi:MAG: glycosyl hydrolase [Leeuwenhoekiella sp.]